MFPDDTGLVCLFVCFFFVCTNVPNLGEFQVQEPEEGRGTGSRQGTLREPSEEKVGEVSEVEGVWVGGGK